MTPEDEANLTRWHAEIEAGRAAQEALAGFYYDHRDDADLWGDPEDWQDVTPLARPKRKDLGIVLSTRFNLDEMRRLDDLCDRVGLDHFALIKQAVEEYERNHRVTLHIAGVRMDGQNVTLAG